MNIYSLETQVEKLESQLEEKQHLLEEERRKQNEDSNQQKPGGGEQTRRQGGDSAELSHLREELTTLKQGQTKHQTLVRQLQTTIDVLQQVCSHKC